MYNTNADTQYISERCRDVTSIKSLFTLLLIKWPTLSIYIHIMANYLFLPSNDSNSMILPWSSINAQNHSLWLSPFINKLNVLCHLVELQLNVLCHLVELQDALAERSYYYRYRSSRTVFIGAVWSKASNTFDNIIKGGKLWKAINHIKARVATSDLMTILLN